MDSDSSDSDFAGESVRDADRRHKRRQSIKADAEAARAEAERRASAPSTGFTDSEDSEEEAAANADARRRRATLQRGQFKDGVKASDVDDGGGEAKGDDGGGSSSAADPIDHNVELLSFLEAAEREELQDFKMNQYKFRKGKVFIAYNTETSWPRGAPRTPAFRADALRLQALFTKLNFEVVMHRGLTKALLEVECRSYAQDTDFSDTDALIFVLLTNAGGTGGSCAATGSDGRPVPVGSLLGLFSNHMCPGLAKKPKVFVVHTVRGGYAGADEDPHDLSRNDRLAADKLQVPDDSLFSFYSVPHSHAWDRSLSGSLFVSELLAAMRSRAGERPVKGMFEDMTEAVAERAAAEEAKEAAADSLAHVESSAALWNKHQHERQERQERRQRRHGGGGGGGGGGRRRSSATSVGSDVSAASAASAASGASDALAPLLKSRMTLDLLVSISRDRVERGLKRVRIAEAGAHVPELVYEIKAHTRDAPVAAAACHALAALCKNAPPAQELFREAGGVAAVLDVMRMHADAKVSGEDAAVPANHAACEVLGRASFKNPHLARELAKDGALQLIVAAIRRFRMSPEMLMHGSYALYAIVDAFPLSKRIANAEKAREALDEVRSIHKGRVQRWAEWADEVIDDTADRKHGVDTYFDD